MRTALDYILYPALLFAGFFSAWLISQMGVGTLVAGTAVYWGFVLLMRWLEQIRPYEPAWTRKDGQLSNDLVLAFIGYLTIPYAAWLPKAITGLVEMFPLLESLKVWPASLPALISIPLGVIVCDLGVYAVHRLGHRNAFVWRLHAVHHGAPRLSVINAGRHHALEAVIVKLFIVPLPILLGIPAEAVFWFVTLRAYGGLLTHANIDMKCGIFNYLIDTPELHRWHHSSHQPETDTNYGATMIWDHVFRTWYLPSDRRPPRNVGLDFPMSSRLIDQLVHPLTIRGHHGGRAPIFLLPEGEAGIKADHAAAAMPGMPKAV